LLAIIAARYGELSKCDDMRSAFTKFDPRMLPDREEGRAFRAKVANPAKDSGGQAPSVANLATLAIADCAFQNPPAFIADQCGQRRIGELPVQQLKQLSFEARIVEWLNQHPAPSTPGRCAWCGRTETPSAVVLPFGTEPGTHAWLHAPCWSSWHQVRRADAIAALGAMDIRA
jgi:hypothetical protein